jgi:RecA-family ATPase
MPSILDIAQSYIGHGWNPVPVAYREKKPIGDGWQTRVIDHGNVEQHFNGTRMNIGVMMGASSHGLTDADLDVAEAIAIAPYILPKTGAVFGRASKRFSHQLYNTDLAVTEEKAAVVFNDPVTKKRLLELRIGGGDKGAQTIFPGSTHKETGEAITWEADSEPASVDGNDLHRRCRELAAYTLLARHWPKEEGNRRHDRALILGGFLARAGKSPVEAKLIVEAITKAAGDPEWKKRRDDASDAAQAYQDGKNTFGFPALAEMFDEAVAKQIVDWLGYSEGSDFFNTGTGEERPKENDQPAQMLPFINMSNWDNEPVPEQEWAVLDRIPIGQTTLFTGEGGYGKSTLGLHLCAAHVLGRDWLKTLPEPGPAIFFEAEDGEKTMHRRLAAIGAHYGATFDDMIRGGLKLTSLFGQDAVLATAARNGKIEPTSLYSQLLQAAGDIKPKMIVIASSANVFAGSEIDRTQTQQFVGLLNRVAMTAIGGVVLIAHPSLTGINTDTGLSGTTQWHNAVRARFYLKGIKVEAGEQPDNDLRELVFKKNQFGPMSANIVLRYRNGLFLPEGKMNGLEKVAHEAKAEEVFLELLKRFTSEGRNLSHNANSRTYAPTVFAGETEAKKHQLRKSDLEAAMSRLFEAKKIHVDTYGRPSRPFSRIMVKTA